jgi:hypothetical protein
MSSDYQTILLVMAGTGAILYFLSKSPTGGGGGNGSGNNPVVSSPISTSPYLPASPGARSCAGAPNEFIVPNLIAPWGGNPQTLVLSNYNGGNDTPYIFPNGTYFFREAWNGTAC